MPRDEHRSRTDALHDPGGRPQTLRWRGGWARLGPWRGQAEIAYVSVGAERPPPPDVVERGVELLRRRGYTAAVTNALTPADALPFVDAGFTVRERLHLLAHDMHEVPRPHRATRRARPADRTAVLAVDDRAFDGFWRLDPAGLDDAVRATPSSRFRVGCVGESVVAYAISGRASTQGYLQRIAVHPDVRGRGWGRAVVADGLGWLSRHGAARTLVNTQLHNEAALGLYQSLGFRRLSVGLCVMGLGL
jgi:ribosomal protein S18 acetylase RimI-like enzyme